MDPNCMLGHLNVGLIHAARGGYDDAAAAFQQASSYSPRFGDPLGLLGHAFGRAGRIAEARVAGAEPRRLSSEAYVSGYIRALYHLGLEEREQALAELEGAYEDRSWLVAMLKVDPLLDSKRIGCNEQPRGTVLRSSRSLPAAWSQAKKRRDFVLAAPFSLPFR